MVVMGVTHLGDQLLGVVVPILLILQAEVRKVLEDEVEDVAPLVLELVVPLDLVGTVKHQPLVGAEGAITEVVEVVLGQVVVEDLPSVMASNVLHLYISLLVLMEMAVSRFQMLLRQPYYQHFHQR